MTPTLNVVASGSSGNCYYIEHGDQIIFVDVGVPVKAVRACGEDAFYDKHISLFITHEHTDHVKGLKPFINRYSPDIYTSEGTAEELERKGFDVSSYFIVDADFNYELDNFAVKPFRITHDSSEPVAYRFDFGERSAAFLTDLGYAGNYIMENLHKTDLVVLESNYEDNMLSEGSYPEYLKRRIFSNKGHLSNKDAVRITGELSGNGLSSVVFAHVSNDNNDYELLEKYTAFCTENFGVKACWLPRETVVKGIKI